MNDVDHAVAVSALKTAGNYIDLLVLREVVIAPPSLTSENYLANADQVCSMDPLSRIVSEYCFIVVELG